MTNKFLLIHGFGTRLKFSNKAKLLIAPNTGIESFSAFTDLYDKNQVQIFDWSIPWEAKLSDILTARSPYKLYFVEKEKARNEQTLNNLAQMIKELKPTHIVAHSMGTYLFLNYLEKYGLPQSVKKIIFAQADFNNKYQITDTNILDNLKTGDLEILNTYCYWDSALFSSIFINFYLPAGFFGWKHEYIKNVYYKLKLGPNYHQQILTDKDFLELCV